MNFEWDDKKAEANLKKHAIDFVDAEKVFLDPFRIERLDDRADYGEDRYQTIGAVEGRILLVVYSDRGDAYRIISARPATQKEKRAYEEAFRPRKA